MHETVLVHAHIHESTERSYVGDGAFQHHAGDQVGNLFHAFFKGRCLKFRAWVAARFIKLRDDIANRWDTEGVIRKIGWVQATQYTSIANKLIDSESGRGGNLVYYRVSLRVHSGAIEWVFATANAQEAG